MLPDFGWFQTAVARLSGNSGNLEILTELKVKLSLLNKAKILLVAHSLPLNDIFGCLKSTESKQVELAADILITFLSTLSLGVLLGQYGGPMFRALARPVPKSKEMVIQVLINTTTGNEVVQSLIQDNDLLLAVVDCLTDEDVQVANAAIRFMIKFGKTSVGEKAIYTDPIFQKLKTIMAQDGIGRFRVYEVGVDLASNSPGGMIVTRTSGVLTALLGELGGEDIQLQRNVIDLLIKLALSPHGLEYLDKKGVCKSLATTMVSIQVVSPSAILLPGLIKFFGNSAQAYPEEIFYQYPEVISLIFDSVSNPDLKISGTALEAIGLIATSVPGKNKLYYHNKMNLAVKQLGKHLTTRSIEWQIQALNVIANLVNGTGGTLDYLTMKLTRVWFDKLCSGPLDVVIAACKHPSPELQVAALQVIQAISSQQWGLEKIHYAPGTVEFLMDPLSNSEKLPKQAKFKVLQIIVECYVAEDVFGSEILGKLKLLVKKGLPKGP